MRHERIVRAPSSHEVQCATYAYSRAGWGRRLRRYLYLYAIHPPSSRPYLPSDETLRTMTAKLPGVRFWESDRFPDRDVFYVYGRKRSIFAKRGDPRLRSLRAQFLCEVGESALSERDIRPNVREAADRFLSDCGFVNVQWTGKDTISYDADGHRHEGRLTSEGASAFPTRRFKRICRGELPFFYGTAPS